MKTIILNGSPRKNWNTATLLKEAKRGAESVGAEVLIFPIPGAGRASPASGRAQRGASAFGRMICHR